MPNQDFAQLLVGNIRKPRAMEFGNHELKVAVGQLEIAAGAV